MPFIVIPGGIIVTPPPPYHIIYQYPSCPCAHLSIAFMYTRFELINFLFIILYPWWHNSRPPTTLRHPPSSPVLTFRLQGRGQYRSRDHETSSTSRRRNSGGGRVRICSLQASSRAPAPWRHTSVSSRGRGWERRASSRWTCPPAASQPSAAS